MNLGLTTWPDTIHDDPPRDHPSRSATWLLGRHPRLAQLAAWTTGVIYIDDPGRRAQHRSVDHLGDVFAIGSRRPWRDLPSHHVGALMWTKSDPLHAIDARRGHRRETRWSDGLREVEEEVSGVAVAVLLCCTPTGSRSSPFAANGQVMRSGQLRSISQAEVAMAHEEALDQVQQIIVNLVGMYGGNRDTTLIRQELDQRLREAGIGEQPAKWLDDTAAEIAAGRTVITGAKQPRRHGHGNRHAE
jgi:hypothetical protein